MVEKTPIPPLYYESVTAANVIVPVKASSADTLDYSVSNSPAADTAANAALYDEKARVGNVALELNGIPAADPAALADMLHLVSEPNSVPGLGGAFEAIIDTNLPPHLMYKQAAEFIKQNGSAGLNDSQRAVLDNLTKMNEQQWESFYKNAIEPADAVIVQLNYKELKSELEQKKAANAAPVAGQPLKFGLRTIERSGDFGQIDAMDDGTKYQMGLAAANSAMEPGYGGHSSYTSPTRTATVYVVDDLAQARATFNMVNSNPNTEMPYTSEESARNDVLRFSAYDMNTHMHHDAVIVSRDFLSKNLGKELEFMKGFEESSKKVTHYSNSGRVNMHDFLEQMKNGSELPINSLADYEQKASLAPPLADRTGATRQNSL